MPTWCRQEYTIMLLSTKEERLLRRWSSASSKKADRFIWYNILQLWNKEGPPWWALFYCVSFPVNDLFFTKQQIGSFYIVSHGYYNVYVIHYWGFILLKYTYDYILNVKKNINFYLLGFQRVQRIWTYIFKYLVANLIIINIFNARNCNYILITNKIKLYEKSITICYVICISLTLSAQINLFYESFEPPLYGDSVTSTQSGSVNDWSHSLMLHPAVWPRIPAR